MDEWMDGYKASSTSEMILQCIWIYHVTTIHVFPELVASFHGSQFELPALVWTVQSWWIHCFMTLRMGIESFQLQKALKYRFLSSFFQCLNLFPVWGVGVNLIFSSSQKLFFPGVFPCVCPFSGCYYCHSPATVQDGHNFTAHLARHGWKTPVTYGGWLQNPAPVDTVDGCRW